MRPRVSYVFYRFDGDVSVPFVTVQEEKGLMQAGLSMFGMNRRRQPRDAAIMIIAVLGPVSPFEIRAVHVNSRQFVLIF